MEKKITSRITKGVIIFSLLVITDIILQYLYHPVPDGIRYLPRMIITFVGIMAACILYSVQSGGGLTFGDLFAHGLKTTAVIAFLMALYTFIAVKWIYPPPGPAEMDAAIKAIEQQGNALHEEAKQQAQKMAANRWIIYVSLSIFVSLIPGLLGSLAAAALTKRISNFNR